MARKQFTVIRVVAIVLLLLVVSNKADIIFNNFDPNDSYHPDYYLAVAYEFVPESNQVHDYDSAMAFIPDGNNYSLDTIELGVTLRSGVNEFDVWVMEDDGNMPGAIIETIHVNDVIFSYPGVYPPVTAISQSTPVFSANTQYWIGLSAPGPNDGDFAWHSNTIGYLGLGVNRQQINGVGEWINYGPLDCTFRVSGVRQLRDIYVDDDGPYDPRPGDPSISDPDEDGSIDHPFDAIQEAIAAAVNEDTVVVMDGIYMGIGNRQINFQGKTITVRSLNGPNNCVVDCQQQSPGFVFNNSEVANSVLEGLTITNGWYDDPGGGGIYCSQASPAIIDCVITDCAASIGGGIYCGYNSNPSVYRCSITNCSASLYSASGGGIYCDYGSAPVISNCLISYNVAYYDGGGLASQGSDLVIQNSAFIHNSGAYGNGGGIYCGGELGYPEIINCTIAYNDATNGGQGGGVYCGDYISPIIKNCVVVHNWALSYRQIRAIGLPTYSCIQDWTSGGTGNITDSPKLKTDKIHLEWDSPCRDAGEPGGNYAGQMDIDGQVRKMHYRVDMGADELLPRVVNIDTGEPYDTIQDAIEDAENGHTIVAQEGSHYAPDLQGIDFLGMAITVRSSDPDDPDVVAATIIDGQGAGRCLRFHNSEGPDSVLDGFTIANGHTLESGGGIQCLSSHPTISNCVIRNNTVNDSEFLAAAGAGIACLGSEPVIQNCTIRNNTADGSIFLAYGAGLYCDSASNPTVSGCTISNNMVTSGFGGGIYFESTQLHLSDSDILNNSPDGVYIYSDSQLNIYGTVSVVGNDLVGPGDLLIESGANLNLDDAEVFCNMSGPGTMEIDVGATAIIDGNAIIDLGDPCNPQVRGTINCEGLLRVKDVSQVRNANMNITEAIFEDNAAVSNCDIYVSSIMPYNAMFADSNTSFVDVNIYATNDNYMNLHPDIFDGNFVNVKIYVTCTEGVGSSRGGLFECRGEPNHADVNSCDPNNTFLCGASLGTIPDCNIRTWTLERLELVPDAKLNLTNRFPFQPPYISGTDYDVVYVKELILRQGSVLNTSYNHIYYENLILETNAAVKNEPLLGFSMVNITFDDLTEFIARVTHNNYHHPNDPNYDRVHVERVVGDQPDPNGMMVMLNLQDTDSNSPTYLQNINAKAKGLFSKSSEEEVLIRFEYLFGAADPNTELVIYLSSIPELGDYNDPNDYFEVARLLPPLPGQVGAVGSGQFGVFQQYVQTGGLDFTMGTRIEFMLLGGTGVHMYINNWDPQVICDGICLDLNWSDSADEEDFLIVIGSFGVSTELDSNGTTLACLEGPFGEDGTVDSGDICSWDWALNSPDRLNLCGSLPLTGAAGAAASSVIFNSPESSSYLLNSSVEAFDDLLISGKRGATDSLTKLEDGLYVFDSNMQYLDNLTPVSERGNIRLVADYDGNIYQTNSEIGIISLDSNEVIVGSNQLNGITEPRYDTLATVYVGIQGTGDDSFGRPVLDAAFDPDFSDNNCVYVVPVVVEPDGKDTYVAAAKLQLSGSSYSVVKLYDDPNAAEPGDNRELDEIREVEVDTLGDLYVLNVHTLNNSEILWKYDTSSGTMKECLVLGDSNSANYIPSPSAMYLSTAQNILYIASSLTSADANSSTIYGFSTSGTLTLTRQVTINGMGHVTGITEDPTTGTLWAVGFSMEDPPDYPNPYELPFYDPNLVEVPIGIDEVTAICTLCPYPDDYLALPLSIVWTGAISLQETCGGADLASNGSVDFRDFSEFAKHWFDIGCVVPDWCGGADLDPYIKDRGHVDFIDLAIFCQNWLEFGCAG